MSLNEKLKMLNLSEEQERIAKEKFMASLALVTLDEFTESYNYLQGQGVNITKANQIKVLTNLCHDLTKKFNVLGETKETDIYRQEPNMLNKNVIDVYRRFQKCNQDGINYKNDDGTYKTFILTEKAFQKKLTERTISETSVVEDVDKMSFEPADVSEVKVVEESQLDNIIDIKEFTEFNKPKEEKMDLESKIMDIKDYQSQPEIEEPEFKTATFEQLKGELLDLKTKLAGELNFNDLSFEDDFEEMRRAA